MKSYFDLSNVDYNICESNALKTIVKDVCSYYKYNNNPSIQSLIDKFNISRSTIINYLKKGNELGWCDYKVRPKTRKIRVYKDNMVVGEFNRIKDFILYAKENYNIDILSHGVTANCQGKISNTKGFVCEYLS